jgi:hypothetical protein
VNGKVTFLLAFSLGAAAGVAVSWRILKTKYEREAREEISEAREEFYKKMKLAGVVENDETEPETTDTVKSTGESAEIRDYRELVTKEGYVDYSSVNEEKKRVEPSKDEPYVITPEEFGEIDEYETITLTHYDDGVLTDDADEPIEDVASMVPVDYAMHFGEFEDDSVHVRNDSLKCDYEILRDQRKYTDVCKPTPRYTEG